MLPKLETRLNRINAGITTARRGLRHRITRLWKGPADDTIVDKWVQGEMKGSGGKWGRGVMRE